MGVKKKPKLLPSLSKNKETTNLKQYPWREWKNNITSCTHPKTLSFRAGHEDIFKTVNSVFFDPDGVEKPESWFTNSSESASFSTHESDELVDERETLEMVVRSVRSDRQRLIFEPGTGTSSILEKAKKDDFPFKESLVMAIESEDPYVDFRKSMEEMVESHGVKDLECLDELITWYLRVNGKKNHGFIVGAFVDLLINLSSTANNNSVLCSSDDSTSYTSALPSFDNSSSSPVCSFEDRNDQNKRDREPTTVMMSS